MTASKIANPAPLGLLGFGMTTVLLNLHNAGIVPLSMAIVAMGIALGGAAQIVAGIMEFKARNTFGATAFTAWRFLKLNAVLARCSLFSKLMQVMQVLPMRKKLHEGFFLINSLVSVAWICSFLTRRYDPQHTLFSKLLQVRIWRLLFFAGQSAFVSVLLV